MQSSPWHFQSHLSQLGGEAPLTTSFLVPNHFISPVTFCINLFSKYYAMFLFNLLSVFVSYQIKCKHHRNRCLCALLTDRLQLEEWREHRHGEYLLATGWPNLQLHIYHEQPLNKISLTNTGCQVTLSVSLILIHHEVIQINTCIRVQIPPYFPFWVSQFSNTDLPTPSDRAQSNGVSHHSNQGLCSCDGSIEKFVVR